MPTKPESDKTAADPTKTQPKPVVDDEDVVDEASEELFRSAIRLPGVGIPAPVRPIRNAATLGWSACQDIVRMDEPTGAWGRVGRTMFVERRAQLKHDAVRQQRDGRLQMDRIFQDPGGARLRAAGRRPELCCGRRGRGFVRVGLEQLLSFAHRMPDRGGDAARTCRA